MSPLHRYSLCSTNLILGWHYNIGAIYLKSSVGREVDIGFDGMQSYDRCATMLCPAAVMMARMARMSHFGSRARALPHAVAGARPECRNTGNNTRRSNRAPSVNTAAFRATAPRPRSWRALYKRADLPLFSFSSSYL